MSKSLAEGQGTGSVFCNYSRIRTVQHSIHSRAVSLSHIHLKFDYGIDARWEILCVDLKWTARDPIISLKPNLTNPCKTAIRLTAAQGSTSGAT